MKLYFSTITLFIIFILNSFYINQSNAICPTGFYGEMCTSILTSVERFPANSSQLILKFNTASNLSSNKKILETIEIESLAEYNNTGGLLRTIILSDPANWKLTLQNSTTFSYKVVTSNVDIIVNAIWSLNYVNSTLNFTTIELRFSLSQYKFQDDSTSNYLVLTLKNSIYNAQIPSGTTVCGNGEIVESDNVYQSNVKLGDSTLMGELSSKDISTLTAKQLNLTLLKTSSSLYSIQTVGIVIPNYNLTNLQFSITYFPMKDPKAIEQTYSKSTVCVTTESDGLTEQEVAAICVALIGFFIIGCVAVYFFVLDGRYINKVD